jgi:excisionase family DNA binding protein
MSGDVDRQLIPLLYTPAEVAKLLSVSRSQVYILMNEGKLKSVHIGRSRRISLKELNTFIDSLPTQTNAPT